MLNVYDTLSQNPMTIYRKDNISVLRCGEIITFYKNNNIVMKTHQPNKVNSVFIMKIVDRLLNQ